MTYVTSERNFIKVCCPKMIWKWSFSVLIVKMF